MPSTLLNCLTDVHSHLNFKFHPPKVRFLKQTDITHVIYAPISMEKVHSSQNISRHHAKLKIYIFNNISPASKIGLTNDRDWEVFIHHNFYRRQAAGWAGPRILTIFHVSSCAVLGVTSLVWQWPVSRCARSSHRRVPRRRFIRNHVLISLVRRPGWGGRLQLS